MKITRRNVLRLGGAALAGVVAGCSRDPGTLDADAPDAGPGGDPSDASMPGAADSGADTDGGHDAGPMTAQDAGQEAAEDAGPESGADAGHAVQTPLPLVFLHMSDIHIGSGKFAVPALDYTLGTLLPALEIDAVFATGDLVETGNDLVSWARYRDLIDAAGLDLDRYFEAPGNHDSLLDGGLQNYRAHTLAGRGGRGTHGVHHLTRGGRRIRVVVVNTASAGDPVRDGAGYLAGGQVDGLISAIDGETLPVDATLVLGHHPPSGAQGLGVFQTDKHLRRLLSRTDACAYLFGHTHVYLPSWDNRTLLVQATTEGNRHPPNDDTGVCLFALDDGPVVKNIPLLGDESSVHVDWPVVMITRPANILLGAGLLGGNNPRAAGLTRNSKDNLLTAVVFAPGGPESVTCRIGGGAFRTMTRVGNAWQALFDAPSGVSVDIEVQASALGRTATDKVRVPLH